MSRDTGQSRQLIESVTTEAADILRSRLTEFAEKKKHGEFTVTIHVSSGVPHTIREGFESTSKPILAASG